MEKETDKKEFVLPVVVTAISYLAIILMVVVMFFVSYNYQEIYNTPRNVQGRMDMTGYDLTNAAISATCAGEWAFYYNQWIVTDEIDGEPDAMMKIPGRWTGMKIGGKRLGRHGYASYKMIIENPRIGERFTIRIGNFPVGSRTFINGELNMTSGTVSKEKGKSTATGLRDNRYPYTVTSSEPLEVVIEIGHNGYGGLFFPPWLEDYDRTEMPLHSFITIVIFLMVGAMACCVIFNFVITAATGAGSKRWGSIVFILLAFLHIFTTCEFNGTFGPLLSVNFFPVMYELCFVSGFITVAAFFFSLIRSEKVKLNRVERIVYCGIFVLTLGLYFLLVGTAYQIVPIMAGLFSLSYLYYKMLRQRKQNPNFQFADLLIIIILTVMFGGEAFYNLGHLNYGLEALISVMLLAVLIISVASAFVTLRKKTARALQAAELQKENERIRYEVYKNQVNPHFIFNTLSSVQALYKHDNEAGDEAIGRFSRHLRRIVDSSNVELHPFDEELKIIMNYVELEKMRLKTNPQILFDINFQDFSVPVLSLQPLIENALRYSGVADKGEGYIRIFSDLSEDKSEVTLIVEDNGKGFELSSVRKNATGLKNTAARYKHLLNAEMEVKSGAGKGTLIAIRIPYKEARDE